MNENPIPLIRPQIEFESVESNIRAILASGQLTSGRFVAEFEAAVAKAAGTDFAVSCTSATTALHLSLEALDIGPGDEVLISDFTFPATANAVIQTGATPVFVDSGTNDFGMDPEALRRGLSQNTRAIMPVDPFGQPADYAAIEALGLEANVPIVADAACSLGATRDGRPAGSHGQMGCFSFHPRKVITCGEGGMVTTNDAHLADRMRLLRSHGAVRDGVAMRFDVPGFNYRMSEIQAALGLSQIGRLDEIVNDRQRTAAIYDVLLADCPGISTLWPPMDTTWTYQSYVVVLDKSTDRDATIKLMKDHGIETTLGTYACHAHPAYRHFGYAAGDLPNAHRFQQSSLTLPVIPAMTSANIERVVSTLVQVLEHA